MPALANLVLTDSVLNDNTFKPMTIEGNVAKFLLRDSTGEPHNDRVVTVSQKVNSQGTYRTIIRMTVPCVHNAGEGFPAPSNTDNLIFEINVRTPNMASTLTRANTLAMMQDLLAEADITSVIKDLESFY